MKSYKNLFKGTDIIYFEEDSPKFKIKMENLEESVEELRSFVQTLVDSCRRYCKTGYANVDAGNDFSNILKSLRTDTWGTRLGNIAPLLSEFGDTFLKVYI